MRATEEHLKELIGEKEDEDMMESDRIFEDVRGAETMVATDMMATKTLIRTAAVKLNPEGGC